MKFFKRFFRNNEEKIKSVEDQKLDIEEEIFKIDSNLKNIRAFSRDRHPDDNRRIDELEERKKVYERKLQALGGSEEKQKVA